MHVMYICIHRLFPSLDLTAFWRGGLMQSNATVELPFDRHKVVIDITFAAWCEVNIEFVEWLVCEAVDAMFCLGYVRKNVRRYVRKHVKRYVRKNVRRYVRKNVKKYAEDMSKIMSKDMSERMPEDMSEDITERMSQDMSERTSEDCFQSVCEVESNRTHFRR